MDESTPLVERIEKLLPGKPDEALEYCRELKGIALEKRKYELLAREEGFRGRGYIAVARVKEGRQTISRTVQWYRRRNLLDSSSSLINSVGADYLQMHLYRDARQWLAAAVKSAVTARTPQVLYKSLYNLGRVEQSDGSLNSAKKYLEKSLTIGESVSEASLTPVLKSLGEVCMKLGEHRRAGEVLVQARALASEHHEWRQAVSTGLTAAELMVQTRQFDQARVLYQESAEAARVHKYLDYEIRSLCGLSQVMIAVNDAASAIQVLHRAQRMLKTSPHLMNPETAAVYKHLALAYRMVFGEQEKSYRYYLEYRRALDSIRTGQ